MAHSAFGSSFSSFALEPAQAAEKVRRHPKYYLNGGDVHFLVENYIFRVHRYFFERESQAFREWLGVPPAPGQQPRGSSDANPYPLDDTREEDFSRFLWVFYNPKYSIYDANDHEWISILKLSHSWDFPEVKRLSIRNIEGFELEPVRKIELYQIYEVDRRLLIPSYVALVNRPQPLTLQEGRRLGLDTALMLATARECARGKKESGKHSPTASSLPADVMAEIVRDVFALKQRTPASPALGPIADGAGPAAFAVTPLSPSRIVTKALPKQDPMSPSPAPISLPPTQHAHKGSESGVKSPTKTKIEIPPYPLAQSISQTANTPSAPKVGDVPEYLANNFATPPSNANANGSAKPSGGSKDATRPASPTKPASKEKEEDKKESKKDTKDKDVKASAGPATPSQAQAPTHNASKSEGTALKDDKQPAAAKLEDPKTPATPSDPKSTEAKLADADKKDGSRPGTPSNEGSVSGEFNKWASRIKGGNKGNASGGGKKSGK